MSIIVYTQEVSPDNGAEGFPGGSREASICVGWLRITELERYLRLIDEEGLKAGVGMRQRAASS